jgi:hypothetical protein
MQFFLGVVRVTAEREATRPDLLARLEALGVPARKFERDHGLPARLVAQMRQGRFGTPEGEPVVRALEAAIAAAEEVLKSQCEREKRQGVAGVASGVAQGTGDTSFAKELRERIRGTNSYEACADLARYVLELGAEKKITQGQVKSANETIARLEQLLRKKTEEDERARAGAPLVVRVIYENLWRPSS